MQASSTSGHRCRATDGARPGRQALVGQCERPTRIAFLHTGEVDFLAAAVGMYPDRAKAIQFSKPYATLDGVVSGRKADAI